MRVIYLSIGGLVGLILLVLVIAIVAALTDAARFGPLIEIIRDIVIILLALEGILIILALTILIAQIARLVNLLQNELKPILENTQETVKHARGTAEFVGKNLSDPVIKANAFLSGVGVMFRELGRIRRAVRRDFTDIG